MAPMRLIEDPPSAASSSEAEEESDFQTMEEDREIDNLKEISADEEKEDADEEHENPSSRNHSRNPSSVFSKQENSLDKDSGFVSDTDSEKTQSSPSASAFTIKPIVRKHISGSSKANKIAEKPSLGSALVPSAGSGLKRPSESDMHGAESKKKKKKLNGEKKKKLNGENEEVKKGSGPGVNRLWSENDEIIILQGMIDFQSTKNSDPYADMSLFHEFIKKNLSVDVSKNQLLDKIRRLKKKYKTNVEKSENRNDQHFLKPHERKSFELSKEIWGYAPKIKPGKQSVKVSNSVSINSPRLEMEAAKQVEMNVDGKIFPDEFLSEYPWLKASFQLENDKLWSEGLMCLVRERMPLLGSDKAKELDEKWRKLSESELELYVKKVELVREQCKLILDSVEKTKSY